MGNKEIKSILTLIDQSHVNECNSEILWTIRWAPTERNGNTKATQGEGREQHLSELAAGVHRNRHGKGSWDQESKTLRPETLPYYQKNVTHDLIFKLKG